MNLHVCFMLFFSFNICTLLLYLFYTSAYTRQVNIYLWQLENSTIDEKIYFIFVIFRKHIQIQAIISFLKHEMVVNYYLQHIRNVRLFNLKVQFWKMFITEYS